PQTATLRGAAGKSATDSQGRPAPNRSEAGSPRTVRGPRRTHHRLAGAGTGDQTCRGGCFPGQSPAPRLKGTTVEKIPTMYERDESRRGRPVTPVLKAECRWVEQGEGVATRKLDGMNVKVEAGVLWKRQKPAGGVYDEASYAPAQRDDPADRYLFEAFDSAPAWPDGIYEALGPKIQGNPEGYERHTLVRVVPCEPWLVLEN